MIAAARAQYGRYLFWAWRHPCWACAIRQAAQTGLAAVLLVAVVAGRTG